MEDENSSSSIDPVIDLLNRLKQQDMAGILVHHARKSNPGQGSYRGSQKLSVIFNSIVRLDENKDATRKGNTEFTLHFEKYRGLRDCTTAPTVVTLTQDDDGKSHWDWHPVESPNEVALVEAVRTLQFPTQTELAEHIGISKGEVTKRRDRAISKGVLEITSEEWRGCLEESRKLRELDTFEDDEDDDY
jgi:hypothetical protein